MSCYIDLGLYYQYIFSMTRHGFTITEIENMMPFERDVYVSLLLNHIQKIEESKKKR